MHHFFYFFSGCIVQFIYVTSLCFTVRCKLRIGTCVHRSLCLIVRHKRTACRGLHLTMRHNARCERMKNINRAQTTSASNEIDQSGLLQSLAFPVKRRSRNMGASHQHIHRNTQSQWPTGTIGNLHQAMPKCDGSRWQLMRFQPIVEEFYLGHIIHILRPKRLA